MTLSGIIRDSFEEAKRKANIDVIPENVKGFVSYLCSNYYTLTETGRKQIEEKAFSQICPEEVGVEGAVIIYNALKDAELPEQFLGKYRRSILERASKPELRNLLLERKTSGGCPIHNDIKELVAKEYCIALKNKEM